MIRIAVMYRNEADKNFDLDYYRNRHMPLVRERYAPHGLVSLEMDEAVSKTGDRAAPFLAIAYMSFPGMDEFLAAMKAAGKEVTDDVKNFTNIEPVVQISQLHKL